MKVVIFAGGYGTRLGEETHIKPKPMVEIGGYPILWHIMKYYSSFGFDEFIILAGYKQEIIKDYFNNLYYRESDVTYNFDNNTIIYNSEMKSKWKVTILNTGLDTLTGGRLLRAKEYLNEPFLLTYGDGLSNIDILKLIDTHKKNKALVTLTAYKATEKFGVLDLQDNIVKRFSEKNSSNDSWINAGYMVVEPKVFDFLENDSTVFERAPLEKIAKLDKLFAHRHYDYWQCMDTINDKKILESEWNKINPKWKNW